LGFLYLAYDETFAVHERLIPVFRLLLGDRTLGMFYFAWIIPGIAIVFVLGAIFFNFLLRLPTKVRRRFLMAGALYIGGAIGFEMIGGRYREAHGYDLAYAMITTIEERLEMGGVIVFIWALLRYCADTEVRLRFGD
jgi:hypothetical protein